LIIYILEGEFSTDYEVLVLFLILFLRLICLGVGKLRHYKSLPKTIMKYLYKSLGIVHGETLGEQLISIDRSASTVGLKNWAKKEYR
jgi:hypothetical protein